MSYLLAISIGPVQDFIAAARRTADLYAGSQVLQEVCKAAAGKLHELEATLIFPSSAQADGANKILVQTTSDPKTLAEAAEKAAKDKLMELWEQARKAEPSAVIDQARAKVQLESFLEFYAAWVPLGDDYSKARREVDRLLAGRKALRDFLPTQQFDDGVPKSPLDPSRATVIQLSKDARGNIILRVPEALTEDQKLKFNTTEFLDAISLLKRLRGAQDLSGKVPQTRTLARMAKDISARNAVNLQEDLDDSEVPVDPPYFAILVADGDRMGDLISQKKTPEEHQKLSALLDLFAKKVQEIVREYKGFPVYTGGDDVLAFLPVNQAIACAKDLSEEFRHRVHGTLSAGVAVVHYREPLSISLQAGREAEKAAKNGGRDSLAVALHTRGGVPVTVVRKWDSLRWLELLTSFAQGDLTQGLAYELRELGREWQDEMNVAYLQAEAVRILGRKERKNLKLPAFESRQDLLTYADQLVIARFLSGIAAD